MKSEKIITMKAKYLCPFCNALLKPRYNIILTVKSSKGDKKGIVLLHPELGNYSFIIDPELKLKQGEVYNFYCPVCFTNLAAHDINADLVKIIMIDEDNSKFDIFFSRIVGQQSTFKIESNDIIDKYGDESSSYLDYFSKKLKDHYNEEI